MYKESSTTVSSQLCHCLGDGCEAGFKKEFEDLEHSEHSKQYQYGLIFLLQQTFKIQMQVSHFPHVTIRGAKGGNSTHKGNLCANSGPSFAGGKQQNINEICTTLLY